MRTEIINRRLYWFWLGFAQSSFINFTARESNLGPDPDPDPESHTLLVDQLVTIYKPLVSPNKFYIKHFENGISDDMPRFSELL